MVHAGVETVTGVVCVHHNVGKYAAEHKEKAPVRHGWFATLANTWNNGQGGIERNGYGIEPMESRKGGEDSHGDGQSCGAAQKEAQKHGVTGIVHQKSAKGIHNEREKENDSDFHQNTRYFRNRKLPAKPTTAATALLHTGPTPRAMRP